MIKIVDISSEMNGSYENNEFSLDKWSEYIERTIPYLKDICLTDMKQSVSPEYSWETYYLPVLNAVIQNTEEVDKTAKVFRIITDGLEKKIVEKFGKTMDVDIILYLGLCNGAGWVTEINGKTHVLLGIEKILELKWNNIDDMRGLILHELGHVYQAQFGVLHRELQESSDRFLWQLFTEGIAMVFEQEFCNDSSYFHQDKDGWKDWCDHNISRIAADFESDYRKMTRENQRYFGDWANYENHSDVGYYLGTCFVRYILNKDSFDHIICYEIEDVNQAFCEFIRAVQ